MENVQKKKSKYEVLFWSIALPGFGQLLNHRYVKGFILIILEFIVNVMGNINNSTFAPKKIRFVQICEALVADEIYTLTRSFKQEKTPQLLV